MQKFQLLISQKFIPNKFTTYLSKLSTNSQFTKWNERGRFYEQNDQTE